MNHKAEKGTIVKPTERSTKVPPARIGLFAALRAFLCPSGSGVSASSRHVISACSGVVAVGVAMLMFAAPAFANKPPALVSFELEPITLKATHVRLEADTSLGGEEVGTDEYRIEYASSKVGPWAIATSGSLKVKALGEDDGEEFTAELHHLMPMTTYYARAVASDQAGETKQEIEFTTTQVSAPEFLCHPNTSGNACLVNGGGNNPIYVYSFGTYETAFQTQIESDGAETEYSVEYGPSSTGPWMSIASGEITVAEDFSAFKHTIKGLEPETTYYIHVTAKNEKGKLEATEHFTTESPSPSELGASLDDVSGTSAQLEGSFNPRSAESHWRFEYIARKALEEGGSWLDGPEGTVSAGEATEKESDFTEELSGLDPDTIYDVRLFAENGHPPSATSPIASFETAGVPLVNTFPTHTFQGEALRLLGSVEPHGYDTHYRFQYVTQRHFEAEGFGDPGETSALDAGAGESTGADGYPTRIVGADLPALTSGETYRFRIVASNLASGEHEGIGGVQSLTVPVPGRGEEGAGEEGGVEAGDEASQPSPCPNEAFRTGLSVQLPDCRAYEQITPVDKEGAKDIFNYNPAEGERVHVGADGNHVMVDAPGLQWGSSPDPSRSTYVFTRQEDGWQMVSARPPGETGGITYGEPALWSPDLTSIGFDHVGWATGGADSPDVEVRVGPAGGPYETIATIPRSKIGSSGEALVAESANASTYVLATIDRTLAPGHVSATTSGNDLYEYSHGVLRQLNVTGEATTIGKCGSKIARGPFELSHITEESSPYAVSADGSRSFFEAVPGSDCAEPANLYMRSAGTQTLDIGAYRFIAANPEDSELILGRNSGSEYEYFLYDVETASAKLLFSTPEELNTPIVSEDFTAIYFQTTGQLNPEAPPLSADSGSEAQNFYRYDIPTASLHFLFQAAGGPKISAQEETSADGRYLYFDGYEVGALPAGTANEKVYRYDNAAGVVQCMSCASSTDPEPKLSAFFQNRGDPDIWRLPASQNGDFVFFDTPSALVPQDVDGEIAPEAGKGVGEHASLFYSTSSDVYEWRKNGIDGCAHVQGCLALITSGTGGLENAFLGTDASGRDVFFATHAQLAATDTDGSGDVYDARIGGGFAPPAPGPVECEGAACSTPLAAPVDSTPASLSFSGSGNLAPAATPTSVAKSKPVKGKAKKKSTKKKKRSKKKAGAKKAKRAGHDRGAKR